MQSFGDLTDSPYVTKKPLVMVDIHIWKPFWDYSVLLHA